MSIAAGWLRSLCLPLLVAGLGGCGGGGGGAPPAPPALASLTPTGGGVGGGTLVTLSGSLLGNGSVAALAVRFGGVPATSVAVVDDSTLTCRTPASSLGPCDVEVVTDHGSSVLPAAFTFHPAPTLVAMNPPRGPIAGGVTRTLTGTGFSANAAGAPTLTIGGLPALSVVVVDDATLTCEPPALPGVGAYDVVLQNANGSATGAGLYACSPVPTLASVAATSGPAGGWTLVTLTGTGFTGGGVGVTFDGAAATRLTVVSDTSLTCLTPEGAAGPADLGLSTYGGAAALPAAYAYTTFSPSDPLFANQWHLENTAQFAPSTVGEDAHVRGAWNLGYTGKGVRVGVVDDGLELLHEDLAPNVVAGASWDYGQNDADPTGNQHGTSVAGVTSAVSNALGGVGAAPNATMAGYAVLTSGAGDGDIADALARDAALTHAYNNSWGSPAFYSGALYGFSDAPTSFNAAVDLGLRTGRGGLGSIYLKAAGNSGSPVAGFDGTNGLRGVNVIGAVNTEGKATYYSQPGPCILVCAPSNDSGHAGIWTTDRTGGAGYDATNYTSTFGGTSSATPLVTGVVALILEVRPDLRWWEVPLVLADSARKNDATSTGWSQNGAGRWIHQQYGFGVVDADVAMDVARAFTPRTGLVSTTKTASVGQKVLKGNATGITSTINVPTGTGITAVHRATVTVFIDHTVASDLNIVLTSPAGTASQLIKSVRSPTTYDNVASGIAMVSWRCLGESPAGNWTLAINDGQNVHDSNWSSWTLTLEGEGTAPTALTAPRARAPQARPAAPEALSLSDAIWWNGERWCQARRDETLLAEWTRGAPGDSWLAGEPEVEGAALSVPGFAVWRLRPSATREALLARAPASQAPRTGLVFRDGTSGNGRLRVLTGRVVVQLAPSLSEAERTRLEARYGLAPVRDLSLGQGWRLYDVSAGGAAPLAVARDLAGEAGVLGVEPDWWVERLPN